MILLLLFSMVYLILLIYGSDVFQNIPESGADAMPSKSFSVCIPYRNEEKNLPALLQSLASLNYPAHLLEIVLCDDHSTDNSAAILRNAEKDFPFLMQLLSNEEEATGKKATLNNCIQNAKHEYILSTDADCILHADWVNIFNTILVHTNNEMVTGPIVCVAKENTGILDNYQSVEITGLVSIAAAALFKNKPFMANGANLCFRKSSFIAVDGYQGNEHIASGDDEFLLQKFHERYPGKICFAKNQSAIVRTYTQENFNSFIQQRSRWAAKAKLHKSKKVFLFQISVALYFLSILLLFLNGEIVFGALSLSLKVIADLLFFARINHFYKTPVRLPDQIIVSILQLFLTPLVGILSMTMKFTWKDRLLKA